MTNWIISSSVLILIVICMRHFLKGKISARLQYAMWIIVAIRLLMPFSFGNSVLSVENITDRFYPAAVESAINATAEEEEIYNQIIKDAVINVEVQENDVNNENTYVPTESKVSYTDILQGIWLIGIGCTVCLFVVTNIIFQRNIKKDRRPIYVNYCKIPIFVSDEVETPCLAGLFLPTIYVTKEVAENSTLLRHTVTHEMMHHKQGDSLWAIIRCVCLALHWYNPLVWWAAVISKKDAEFSCDEATIKVLGEEERKEYGKTLIQLSSKEKYNLFVTATAMTSGKKSVKERIMLIAKKPKVKWYTLLVCILVVCVAVGCTFTQGEKQDDSNNKESIKIDEDSEILEETNMESEEVRKELERVVSNIGLENAFPWNNTVELKEDANALIKMVSDETGRFEIYGIMSAKYGTYGLLLNDWVGGEQNWNFVYVPWYYSGAPSEQPILELDGEGKYKFLYVYDWDEVPLWQEYILDCGYDTGHMELESSAPDYWVKPDERKVCLAVMPDGISQAGGDYRYIIPKDQTKWMDGYKQMRSLARGDGKWKTDEQSMGVWVVYGDEWTCITDQGFIFDFEKRIEKSEAEDFYNLCMEEAKKNDTGTPVRPEEIVDITYAKILGEVSYPIRDKEILEQLEKSLNSSTEIRGGAACTFTIPLYLELNNRESRVIYLASDTCSTWLSDGVYYEDKDGVTEGIRDMVEASLFVTEFTKAYFTNDMETLKEYMMPTASVEVTGYSEGEKPPTAWTIDGLEACIENLKSHISIEFKVSEDADYYVYLEMNIRKHEGEWKVESYWLEQ